MTRGTTLVASASTSHSCTFGEHACGLLATQQGTTIMPSCLITEHEPDCAYWWIYAPRSGSDSGVMFSRLSGTRSQRIGLAKTILIRLTRLRRTEP